MQSCKGVVKGLENNVEAIIKRLLNDELDLEKKKSDREIMERKGEIEKEKLKKETRNRQRSRKESLQCDRT